MPCYALLGAHADRALIGAWNPMLCPIWGVRLDRKKCEDVIRRSVDGTYVCRESSSGDKYIICIKHGGAVKNFQVYIKGVRQLLALALPFGPKYSCAFAALHHLALNTRALSAACTTPTRVAMICSTWFPRGSWVLTDA